MLKYFIHLIRRTTSVKIRLQAIHMHMHINLKLKENIIKFLKDKFQFFFFTFDTFFELVPFCFTYSLEHFFDFPKNFFFSRTKSLFPYSTWDIIYTHNLT